MSRFVEAAYLVGLLALSVTGCATTPQPVTAVKAVIQRHPVATAVLGGIVVGSIAVSSDSSHRQRTGEMPAICRSNPEACK